MINPHIIFVIVMPILYSGELDTIKQPNMVPVFWELWFLISALGQVGEGVSKAELCCVNCHNFAGHGIPFGIIFGGTDLNEDVNQGEKIEVMGKVLEEAR